MMICNVRSLISRVKSRSFLKDIITSSNEVFKDFVSDMAVEISTLGIPTRETAVNTDTVKPSAGSEILTPQLQGK